MSILIDREDWADGAGWAVEGGGAGRRKKELILGCVVDISGFHNKAKRRVFFFFFSCFFSRLFSPG
jgi:hypothetical protein